MKLFRRFLLVLFMLLVIPFSVNAEGDYTALNLEQALN